MTSFRPCIGCIARNDCEIKNAAMKALRGVPITSAKIKCDLPWTEHFPPGTRALVKVWDHSDDASYNDYEGCDVMETMVPATVIGKSSKKPGKLLLHLDTQIQMRNEVKTEFRAAWPKEIKRLDEPRAAFCKSCKTALVHGKCGCREDYAEAY